jgi:hypothetical protein
MNNAPVIELKLRQGRPAVFENGRRLATVAYDNSILRTDGEWEKRVQDFIDIGVKLFHLTPWHHAGVFGQTAFWTDEDVYPEYSPPAPMEQPDGLTLEKQASFILRRVPEAHFIVRLNTYAPPAWVEKNPGEIQTDEYGRKYQPSWASQKYLSGVRGHYRNLIGYVERQEWGRRVIGYFVMPYGEGLSLLSVSGKFFDHCVAMQRAWRQWLRHKYSDDAALREAWGDSNASLQDARPPTDAKLREKLSRLFHWPQPQALARERDYCLLQRELFRRYFTWLLESVHSSASHQVLVGIDALKQHMLGWQLAEAFADSGGVVQASQVHGTDAFSMFLASGSFCTGDLLDHPALDCLVTPADYTARGVGLPWEGEGLGDSLMLRSKTLVIENDARTWLAQETAEMGPPLGSFMNIEEVRAGLQRNSALCLSRGFLSYWMDIGYRAGNFHHPQIKDEVARDMSLQLRGADWPHRETEHAIAVIIDDASPLYENFTTGFQNLAILRQRIEGLGLCGIPYRIYLLRDLQRDDFPSYRCYLFPNLFKVDDEVCRLLRQRVLRDGRLAIFGPGTGITDGRTLSSQGAELLTGITMRLFSHSSSRRVHLHRGAHPTVTDSQLPPLFGDSFSYGPILVPDRAQLAATQTRVLGEALTAFTINHPGLVLREQGTGASGNGNPRPRGAADYAVVFSAAVPLPAALLRSLARYAGCNVWSERDAVVAASDTMVSLHTNESGLYTIRLPRVARHVHDAATGEVVMTDTQQWTVSMAAPQTNTYFF